MQKGTSQDMMDAIRRRSFDKRLRKEFGRLGPVSEKVGQSQSPVDGRKEREKKRRKCQDLSKTWSESWRLLAKQRKTSERVLWEFCPERCNLGNGGIRQPRLLRPTSEAEIVLASGGGRAL
jgi:hypothetical protein